jgi:hypothetical protein
MKFGKDKKAMEWSIMRSTTSEDKQIVLRSVKERDRMGMKDEAVKPSTVRK